MNVPLPSTSLSLGNITANNLHIFLGEGKERFEAVHDISFSIKAREFVCILGPSGCGKSTLLGALAGHLRPQQGVLQMDDKSIQKPAPERGMVFQHHSLLPWKRVIHNVAFGLKMQGVRRKERLDRAQQLLKDVGLHEFAQRWPHQLSGGMQQRAEIARVLINQPKLLLMDEPFGALDAQTRAQMQSLLLQLWSQHPTTVVFVTHDIDEALLLADRILVMSPRPGRLIDDIALPATRPRTHEQLTQAPWVQLKRHCLNLLKHPNGQELPRLTPLGLPNTTEL